VEEGEVSRGGDSKEGRKDEKGMKMDVSLHVLSFFLSFTRWFGRQSCLLEKAKKGFR
jgi:hypothetical protein